MPFLVIFMNCTGGHDCRTLQYYMGFSDARQVPLERFNEWNREKRFARAYRDESGDPVLEMDVDVDFSGLPRENIRETRSEERRVGKECVSKGRSGWWPDHQ